MVPVQPTPAPGAYADRVVLLANGRVAAQGSPQELRDSSDPLVRQFVNAQADGPVRFEHPAQPLEADFLAPGGGGR